jgi:hypothetical protein
MPRRLEPLDAGIVLPANRHRLTASVKEVIIAVLRGG